MGWANRRTPFGRPRYAHISDDVRAHSRKGVGWSALHSFGCTAPKVAKQILQEQKTRAGERTPAREINFLNVPTTLIKCDNKHVRT